MPVPLRGILLLTMTLGGCQNTSTTRIDAKDNTVALPALRMAYNFDHEKQAASPHNGHAIEFGITTARGSSSQVLSPGQLPIILNQTTFTAPQQLRNDFDFTDMELLWRYRFRNPIFNDDKLSTEISVGAGSNTINLKVASATQVASRRVDSTGLRVGLGLIYRLGQSSSIQMSALGYGSPFVISGADQMLRYELVYAKTYLDNFRVRAGYAIWHVKGSLSGPQASESDFYLELSGPTLALDLEF